MNKIDDNYREQFFIIKLNVKKTHALIIETSTLSIDESINKNIFSENLEFLSQSDQLLWKIDELIL